MLPLALALAACPPPTGHVYSASSPEASRVTQERLQPVLDEHDFHGDLQVSGGPADGAWSGRGRRWPWASVTKQVVATLVMQEVEAARLSLDAPVTRYMPDWPAAFRAPTVRQLLRHQSGLANPDDSPEGADGFPSAYAEGVSVQYCLLEMTPPTTDGWRYNNCDYVVLGRLLETVTGTSLDELIRTRIAAPSGWTDTRLYTLDEVREYHERDAAYDRRIAGYGSAAALIGPLRDMIGFDRALLAGKLLSQEARSTMWEGDPSLGFMALGQWSFEAPLAGCATPVRIVERRGGIGKYQVRNVILPDRDIVVAIATAQDAFDFGEIWTGRGFMHDTLSAIACP